MTPVQLTLVVATSIFDGASPAARTGLAECLRDHAIGPLAVREFLRGRADSIDSFSPSRGSRRQETN